MNNKSLLVLSPLMLILTACSSFSGSEPPAPVARSVPAKKSTAKKVVPHKEPAVAAVKKQVPGTATYAIESSTSNFKDEANLPAFRAEPLMPPAETLTPSTPVAPSIPSVGASVAPVAVAALPKFVIEDAAVPSGTSPAVVALIAEADKSRNSGDLDSAVVVMERALRIDARNPTLTYKLAQLRVKQNKPQLAEELAGKAALLAGSDLDLKRKSWLLIAEARQMQQNPQGAREAKAKAESFFGR